MRYYLYLPYACLVKKMLKKYNKAVFYIAFLQHVFSDCGRSVFSML